MGQEALIKELIHKIHLANNKLEFINDKTDILFLSLTSSHLSGMNEALHSQMVAVYEKLKTMPPDDEKRDEVSKQFNKLREELSILGMSFRTTNLALEKLMVSLAPKMEDKYPVLKGDFSMLKKIKEDKREVKKDGPEVPVVREPPRVDP
jgi:hypothetical protein